jgi:uncharacterized membrane protein HdeD (DUF308 family)
VSARSRSYNTGQGILGFGIVFCAVFGIVFTARALLGGTVLDWVFAVLCVVTGVRVLYAYIHE